MLLVIIEIYESSSTFVFPLNLLVVQKYIIPAVKRIYWCLKGVVSDVPYSTVISLVVKKRFRKDCSLGFHTRWEIRYGVRWVSYFSSIHCTN